jgi:RecA-family ATPase
MISKPSTPNQNQQPKTNRYLVDLREFLGEEDPGDDPDAWIIEGIIPAGVPCVIAGPPKTHKTWFAELVAVCVASGKPLPFATHIPIQQRRVLVVAREDSVRETRKRIWRISKGLGVNPLDLHPWLSVNCETQFYFDQKPDVEEMKEALKQWKPSLVIMDSLSRTHRADENSKKEMSIVTSIWGDLCSQYKVTVAMIHHFTKSGNGTLLQKLRGTGDIGALARHLIAVESTSDGSTELSFEGNLHPLPAPMSFQMRDVCFLDDKIAKTKPRKPPL